MHYLVNFAGDLFGMLVIFQYLSAVNEKIDYPKILQFGVGTLCFGIIFIGSNFVFSQSTAIFLFMLAAFFILNWLYKSKWYMKILHSVVLYIIMAIPEFFVGILLTLLEIDLTYSQENIYIYTICNFTSKLISFFVVRFIKLFFKKNYVIDTKGMVFLIPLPIATILMIALLIRTCFIVDDPYYRILTLVASVVLVFANLSIFFFIDRMSDYTEKKQRLLLYEHNYEVQKQHFVSVQEHMREVAAFRHNTKNQMLTLIGLVEAGETEKAVASMYASLDIISEEAKDIVSSGNPAIDALLQQKMREAKAEGIFMKISIKTPEAVLIEDTAMGVLVGNLVDNAVEATARLEKEKRRPIDIRVLCDDGMLTVSVKNAVDGEVDTDKLITVKRDRKKHGYGIDSINKIAREYGGAAEFMCENNVFTACATMNNRPKQRR